VGTCAADELMVEAELLKTEVDPLEIELDIETEIELTLLILILGVSGPALEPMEDDGIASFA
jgi:hypothetical protein